MLMYVDLWIESELIVGKHPIVYRAFNVSSIRMVVFLVAASPASHKQLHETGPRVWGRFHGSLDHMGDAPQIEHMGKMDGLKGTFTGTPMKFHGKKPHGFRLKLSRENQSIDMGESLPGSGEHSQKAAETPSFWRFPYTGSERMGINPSLVVEHGPRLI